MQNLPEWAEPKEYNYEQQSPNCNTICNPTNSGQAGVVCGCTPKEPQEIPIPIIPLLIIALIYGLWKIKKKAK